MVEQLLANQAAYPVLGHNPFKYVPIDLSKKNPDLAAIDVTNVQEFEQYIGQQIRNHGADVAFGGYNESRNIYQRSEHFKNSLKAERHIHLGIDLWAVPYTPVFTPIDGLVHSYANNEGLGNYGPTIILEHQLGEGSFYTLYGHLTPESIQGICEGQKLAKGYQFCAIGNYPDNGNYPPHLHFQVIKNLKGMKGDFPGVTSDECQVDDLENCPDPNLILKL